MRLVLLGAVYLLFIVFLAYKHYEYPFSSVLGKNSLKKLVVWDVLRNFATLSTSVPQQNLLKRFLVIQNLKML